MKSVETTAGQDVAPSTAADAEPPQHVESPYSTVEVKLTQGTAGAGVLVDDQASNGDAEIAQASLQEEVSSNAEPVPTPAPVPLVATRVEEDQVMQDLPRPATEPAPTTAPLHDIARHAAAAAPPPPVVEVEIGKNTEPTAEHATAEQSIQSSTGGESLRPITPRKRPAPAVEPIGTQTATSRTTAPSVAARISSLTQQIEILQRAVVESEPEYHIRPLDLQTWRQDTLAFPLHDVLEGANKVVSTTDWTVALQEKRFSDAIERIDELKKLGKWSLRQPERARCVPRRKCHRDFLLEEMKWLRTDFREERKWKLATAQKLAHACQQWHLATDKAALCIAARPIEFITREKHHAEDVAMEDAPSDYQPLTPTEARILSSESMPLPMPGMTNGLCDSHLPRAHAQQVQSPPLSTIDDSAHVFQLGSDEVCAYLPEVGDGQPTSGVLASLPVYRPLIDREEEWIDPYEALPLITTSLYATTPVQVRPAKKARRTLADLDRDDGDGEPVTDVSTSRRRPAHLGLQMRPPLPPHNFEARQKATWTAELDEHLLAMLSEYGYNWDLIAQALTPANVLYSTSERKTAWDCFERWIQTDPRANDVVFTGAHARLVQTRVDDMVRAPRADRNAPRRVYPMPRSHQFYSPKARHFTMLDAMRKVQRKRENNQNNNNKPNVVPKKATQQDQNKAAPTVPTPAQLAHLKYERDQQIARAFHETKNQQLLAMQAQQQAAAAAAAAQRQGGPAGAAALAAQQANQVVQASASAQAQLAQAQQAGTQLTPQQQQQQQILQAQVQAQAQAMQQAALAARQGASQGVGAQQGKAPTPAQIAILRQAQAHRAQLAQQQAAQAAQAAQANMQHAANGSPRPVSQASPVPPRPSLVGQLPPRASPGALMNGIPAHQLAASLRLPPGTRLTPEQMQTLIQQARQAKGLAGGPTAVNNGMVMPNGMQHQILPHLQAQAVQRFQAAQAKAAGASPQMLAQQAQRAGTPLRPPTPQQQQQLQQQQQQLQRNGTPTGAPNGHPQNGSTIPAQPSPLSAGTPVQRASSSPHPNQSAKIEKAR